MITDIREVLKRLPYTLRVGNVPGGIAEYTSIQAAINYANSQTPTATNPWTIYIYPGFYNEQITCSDYVNLKGVGPPGGVVIYQNDATVIILPDNSVELQNFTVRLGTPSAGRSFLSNVSATAMAAKIIGLHFEVVTPGAFAIYIFNIQNQTPNILIENCFAEIGGTGASATLYRSLRNGGTIRFSNNYFRWNNANAAHLEIHYTITLYSTGNRWAGTASFLNKDNTLLTATFDNDACISTGAWVSNVNSSITFRNCAIEAPVVAGNLAIVRLKNCFYRAIQRTGTGNIVDESPTLKDVPWKVHKWDWMAALASMDVGVRGTPVDGGSGQILLEVTDNVAGQEAVESNPEAAGALGTEFTPARTPRFLTQISAASFDANVTMFYGLRKTLGDYVPAATEDHAGFIWDGTNFKASSDNGVATETTNLALPSTGAQHQLEVIVFGGVRVEFYVDGVLVATHTTRVPSAVLDWQHLLETAGGGTGDVIDVTVRNGGIQECPA